MKKVKIIITLILVFLLFYLRLSVRLINTPSEDEIAEIAGFKSIKYLIIDYLPRIPGGSPGGYLIVYPLNKISPNNILFLGLPGLISHFLVFLIIPKSISKLKIIKPEYNFLVSSITRLFFVLDPTLVYQSMEIRPYAFLPLYWIISIFLVSRLIKIDKYKNKSLIKYILFSILLTVFFVWHFYVLIMFLSIYFFIKMRSIEKFSFQSLLPKSIIPIFSSIILASPFWIYFSQGKGAAPYNTFGWLHVVIAQIYAIDKGSQKGIIWQNWLYFFLIVLIITLILYTFLSYLLQRRNLKGIEYLVNFIYINSVLVVLPIIVIILLDISAKYMFLYRQFVWIAIPFYISTGILVARIINNRLKKESND